MKSFNLPSIAGCSGCAAFRIAAGPLQDILREKDIKTFWRIPLNTFKVFHEKPIAC